MMEEWDEPENIYEEYDLRNRINSNDFNSTHEKYNAINYLRERGHDIK